MQIWGDKMQRIEIYSIANFDYGDAKLPLYSSSVSAGIPAPVSEDIEEEVDLNSLLIQHPNSTFFARVVGDAKNFEGIKDGDMLIIDTYNQPSDGKLVLVQLNKTLAIRRYRIFDCAEYLETPMGQFIPINNDFFESLDFVGVITHLIHSY